MGRRCPIFLPWLALPWGRGMPQLHQGEARKGVLSLDLSALGQHQKETFLPHLLALPQRIHTQDGQANDPLKQHQVSLGWYMILSAPKPFTSTSKFNGLKRNPLVNPENKSEVKFKTLTHTGQRGQLQKPK